MSTKLAILPPLPPCPVHASGTLLCSERGIAGGTGRERRAINKRHRGPLRLYPLPDRFDINSLPLHPSPQTPGHISSLSSILHSELISKWCPHTGRGTPASPRTSSRSTSTTSRASRTTSRQLAAPQVPSTASALLLGIPWAALSQRAPRTRHCAFVSRSAGCAGVVASPSEARWTPCQGLVGSDQADH